MDLPSPWTFVLFTLCFVALIAGTLSVGEGEAETE